MKPSDWDKISKDYNTEIMNPLDHRVKNPLWKELKNIKNKDKKSILEIGCGLGRLSPYLKDFKKVLHTDYSKGMIKKAQELNPNSNFKVQDMLNLKEHKNKFNIVISINSIIMAKIKEVDQALEQARNSLKRDGTFLAIFPSLDSDIYRAALTFERELKKSNETYAAKKTHNVMDSQSYDLLLGYFDNDGTQIHFFQSALNYRLKKAGFKNIEFKKVKYPWDMAEDTFPDEEPLWDWFVKAKV